MNEDLDFTEPQETSPINQQKSDSKNSNTSNNNANEDTHESFESSIKESIEEQKLDKNVEKIATKVSEDKQQKNGKTNPIIKFVEDLLRVMVEKSGSDLFITAGAPAAIKIFGELTPVSNQPLQIDIVRAIVYGLMNDAQAEEFTKSNECNFAISIPNVGRFRINAFIQRGAPGLVARTITTEIPNLEDLGMPKVLNDIIMEKRGMVLMVGGTGSGKSTTLAAMIGYRNANAKGHIITLEDPIEYVHPHHKSIVMQREVGADTKSWFAGLKNTLRQAPDVILIGEIRDEDTMEFAITFAETGHLCLSTLHANNANQALDRIINFFPEERRKQLLNDLSLNMKAIISQRLIPKKGGGRVAAIEILLNTPLISDLILNGRMHEIKGIMEKSREQGMLTFDQCLADLVTEDKVEPEVSIRYADSVNALKLKLRSAGIVVSKEKS